MAEYMNKEAFLSSMGLTGDETKYGNRDAEHQHRSYSSYMSYEIIDSVEDSLVEEELVPVVRCKDCKHYHWKQEPCHGKTEHLCDRLKMEVFKDFYCWFGKKKGGNGNG